MVKNIICKFFALNEVFHILLDFDNDIVIRRDSSENFHNGPQGLTSKNYVIFEVIIKI